MKARYLCGLLVLIFCGVTVTAKGSPTEQTVTLYSFMKYKSDYSRSAFSFERASFVYGKGWDLLYGSLSIGDDLDWFSASTATDNRSLIRDMGEINWFDSYKVPVITPLPKLEPGKQRTIKVDSSGDTGKAWAEKNGIFVKAIVGHMYAMHVKDTDSDYYALFRVEAINPGDSCTISWRIVASPE
jgi:hypothetical protein